MIMGSSIPNAPYSQASPYANYPVAWYGGPVPLLPSGPACKTRPSWRMTKVRGLGDCMNYSDILSAIGGPNTNCDPHDSTCVMVGAQKANAAEDAMLSSSCIPPGTPISFTPDTSAAALSAFMGNQPVQPTVNVGTGVVTEKPAGGVTATPTYQPSNPPALPSGCTATTCTWDGTSWVKNPAPPAPPPGGGSGGSGNGSGGTGGSGTGTSTNFLQTWIDDLTSGTDIITGLPNWALIVGAVAGVVILAQASGGRR